MSANDPIQARASADRRNVYDARMQAMEAGATDARLNALGEKIDELGRRMEKGFERVDAELREQRQETKAGFERVDAELREQRQQTTAGFKQVDERFERMYRMMVSASVLIIVALVGAPHL